MYPFSDADLRLFLALLSALLSVIACLPYITDTLAGRVRPHRASWLIWSVLGSISFCSLVYEGAGVSLWFAGARVSCAIVIFLAALRYGAGQVLARDEVTILAAASVGLALWYATEDAAWALAITISISCLGGIATIRKAYRDPSSESLSLWSAFLVASALGVLSVEPGDPVVLAYPLYLLVLCVAITVAMLAGRLALRDPRPVFRTGRGAEG